MTDAKRQAANRAERAMLAILRDTRIDEDTSERELRHIATALMNAVIDALEAR